MMRTTGKIPRMPASKEWQMSYRYRHRLLRYVVPLQRKIINSFGDRRQRQLWLVTVTCISLVYFLSHRGFLSFLWRIRGRNGLSVVLNTDIRIFGPSNTYDPTRPSQTRPWFNQQISFQQYSLAEKRNFMVRYGSICQGWTIMGAKTLVLDRYDLLQSSPYHQNELWKYCMLYTGTGNFYFDGNNLAMLQDWSYLAEKIHKEKVQLIALQFGNHNYNEQQDVDERSKAHIHESLLYLSQSKSQQQVALKMIRILVETPIDLLYSQDLLPGAFLDEIEMDSSWHLWTVSCRDLAPQLETSNRHSNVHPLRPTCTLHGGFCCQVTWNVPGGIGKLPILAMKTSGRVNHVVKGNNDIPQPYNMTQPLRQQQVPQKGVVLVDKSLEDDLPYISTVQLVDLKVPPASLLETPNFFDILLQNDCLPTQKDCHLCLQRRGNCTACARECPCYCRILCRIRPPRKRVVQEIVVRPPVYRKDPSRLIPRIIHQTWYETITPTKYPQISRLVQSWNTSGWEYRFYDDEMAAKFLSQHFPSQVREAYDALVPGAFKADLFRYCVLLIYGGIYADIDLLLESNLDHAIAPDVGFMTPIDEPGSDVGHRSCLWNGLLAVAPGHPVMAKVVELVVNHIRNRFTSVDYDDMLCPNPILSVSHSMDILFTSGPCILGAALNQLMKRHAQADIPVGTLDVWNHSHSSTPTANHRYQMHVTATGGGNSHHIMENYDDNIDYDEYGQDQLANDNRKGLMFPGRTIILNQNKQDMGAHRFTWLEENIIVASTDLPDCDDRSSQSTTSEHYSKAHENVGVFGLRRLYHGDVSRRVNENLRVRILSK